jgi:hypothetical protein
VDGSFRERARVMPVKRVNNTNVQL